MRPLGHGGWLATHAIRIDDGAGRRHRLVLRRWARPGWAGDDPTFYASTEAAVLDRLAVVAPDLPAPRLVAVDPDGRTAGTPALLLTHLPGRPPSAAAIGWDAVIHQLVDWLILIHALDGPLERITPGYRSYSSHDELGPPAGSGRPELWARAVDLARQAPPTARARFLHRDYHPGNTLWQAGRLTGIVDWTGASWGPPAADLAHLRGSLAIGPGMQAADRAERLYGEAGGSTDHQRWWDVRTVLDYVPDLSAEAATSDGLARLEAYLESILQET